MSQKMSMFPSIKILTLEFMANDVREKEYSTDKIVNFLSAFPWVKELYLSNTLLAPPAFLASVAGCKSGHGRECGGGCPWSVGWTGLWEGRRRRVLRSEEKHEVCLGKQLCREVVGRGEGELLQKSGRFLSVNKKCEQCFFFS